MADTIKSVIVFFSTGKDSIVLLDICYKYIRRVEVIFLYLIPNLIYKNKLLNLYEKRYNIKIHQFPQYDISKILKIHSLNNDNIKVIKQRDIENYCRNEFNIEYCAYGYKLVDSVFRGGILNDKNCINGINQREKRIYPLMRWNNKDIMLYIKNNKLPLSFEYDYGFRDINIFKGASLEFIRRKSPLDYQKIINFYPFLQYERK